MATAVLPAQPAFAQGTSGTVVVHVTSEAGSVEDAVVQSGSIHRLTGRDGTASLTLPIGACTLIVSRIGYSPDTLAVTVATGQTEVSVVLTEISVKLGDVVVLSTRTERRVADEPTRVEVTDREDVQEQVAASPGNVAELLTEAGGVRAQRTSASLGNTSVRVRGLRGRYTKFLSDGLPLFGVSTEGLTPLQIPPIDLERVEVIKGVASALYGPTALGGVVNLVSQRASARPEILFNQTSRGGTDVAFWNARRLEDPRWGYTLLAGGDNQKRQDIDRDGWADIPAFQRGVLRPRLFWADSLGNSWFLTGGVTAENRTGGTLPGAKLPDGYPFQEELRTRRADFGTVARRIVGAGAILSLRGSATEQWRMHRFGTVRERDRRNTLFGEASITLTRQTQALVAGAAIERDAYHAQDVPWMNYDYITTGLFAEHLWFPKSWFSLSSSVRLDFHNKYGAFLSPRVSLLFRPSQTWNARLSAGTGVFAPTPFTEETEVTGLTCMLPPSPELKVERARGASIDLSGTLGSVEIDASLFGTIIENPVALYTPIQEPVPPELVNAAQPTRGGGAELFARYKLEPISITASYAFLYQSEFDVDHFVRREVPLNPRHAGGLTIVWEEEDDMRAGLEAYYAGRQALSDDPYRSTSRPFLFADALVQRRFGRFVVFLHGENLNNVRQTRWDPLLWPRRAPGSTWTTDIWAPLEGRVFNVGVRWMY